MSTIPALPETAPFSPTQRAWLNGFFAALLGGDAAVAQTATAGAAPPSIAAAEDFPWHDPALSLDERVALAEGRPRARVLMSAMAQLDCGQCGYLCQTYAEALDSGAEKSLKRCVPGGRDTARRLQELITLPASPTPIVGTQPAAAAPAPALLQSPAAVRLAVAAPLNDTRSDKDTRHVVFKLEEGSYEVGDSLGVHAENCPGLVDAVIEQLEADPEHEVDCADGKRVTLRNAFLGLLDIARPSSEAIEVLASRARDADEADRLQALAEDYPGAEPAEADLLDLLQAFPSSQPPLQELVSALGPLQPRLYSIASSAKAHPGEVHLTVSVVRYERRGRKRKGVASTYLAERLLADGGTGAFVKSGGDFRLPAAPDAPVIMIGPGTGVAPFRAFLEERRATGARGRNWLFFGDRRRDYDYLYRDELETYEQEGLLTRLDTAFSRDKGGAKVYVQQRMREQAFMLWSWLQDGAHLYVCGDASRMARDIDTALIQIVARQGGLDAGAAKAYVTTLAREGRYRRDVY